MIHDTQTAQISRKQDERNIYEIMKTMCPPGNHHNGFVATHAVNICIYIITFFVYVYGLNGSIGDKYENEETHQLVGKRFLHLKRRHHRVTRM